ncbi:hypothetical protein [Gymnodinialimonas hymeniacidonis]|uniref:hypothetical protein n=1 Tax=Gymnodinialimonas hymeniacidonis TaxID=3126508 RepID=UPI0034C670AD
MTFSDLSGSAKGAAVLAILSLLISINFSSTSNLNGVVNCSYFDVAKLGFGVLAVLVGLGGVMSARKDLSSARTMNMVVPGIAALVGVFSALVGLGLIGGPC